MHKVFGKAYWDYHTKAIDEPTPIIVKSSEGHYQSIRPQDAFEPSADLASSEPEQALDNPEWVLDVGETSISKHAPLFPSAETTNVTKEKATATVSEAKGIPAEVVNKYRELPFKDSMFDVVVANSDVFPASTKEESKRLLSEFSRVSRRDGFALVEFIPAAEADTSLSIVASYKGAAQKRRVSRFTKEEFEEVLQDTPWQIDSILLNGDKALAVLSHSRGL